MKKKFAILLASLSFCACGFIGCENDENEKADLGEKCGESADGKLCKNDLTCINAEDGSDKICQEITNGYKDACAKYVQCEVPQNASGEKWTDADCNPSSSSGTNEGGSPLPPVECTLAQKAYYQCVAAAECSELLQDPNAMISCKDKYIDYHRICQDNSKVLGEACEDSRFHCVEPIYACHKDDPSASQGVCKEPVAGEICDVLLGCSGGADGDFECIQLLKDGTYGRCMIKDGKACAGETDENCISGKTNCMEDSEKAGQYICQGKKSAE